MMRKELWSIKECLQVWRCEIIKLVMVGFLANCSLSYAGFQDAVVGEWDGFDSSHTYHYYQYLKVNKDLSAVFATSKDGVHRIYEINSKSVKIGNGYYEMVVKEADEGKIMLVVSAWSNNLTSLLTGKLFLYSKDESGELSLYNTIDIRLLPANGEKLISDVEDLHVKMKENFID